MSTNFHIKDKSLTSREILPGEHRCHGPHIDVLPVSGWFGFERLILC